MPEPSFNLRELVAEVVRESVADMVKASLAEGLPTEPGTNNSKGAPQIAAEPPVAVPGEETRVSDEGVKISSDQDLDQFVRRLLTLFENPKKRQDLRAGRLKFHLVGQAIAEGQRAAIRRVDKGAVTEKVVIDAGKRGESLLLARSAVLTPLAREKARALGVEIKKEH